jgi:hypothetical protein
MVVFVRLSRWSRPLIFSAATGLIWTTYTREQENSSTELQSTIRHAELLCQAFKEQQGIPGITINSH